MNSSTSRTHQGLLRSAMAVLCIASCIACGDDDDAPSKADAGTTKDAGTAAGKGGSTGSTAGHAGGTAGNSAAAGSSSSEQGGMGGTGEDLDAGTEPDADVMPEPPRTLRSVAVHMTGMSDEVGHFVQFRLVGDGHLKTIAVTHELAAAAATSYTFTMPNAAPVNEELQLLVWADTAGVVDQAYEAGMDHAWLATIPAGTEDAVVELPHGDQTTPPDANGPSFDVAGSLGFSIMNTGDWSGDPFELRVYEQPSGRLVGRQLLPVPGMTTALEVYGVIQNGMQYHVDFAVDDDSPANGYQAPPGDPAFRQTVTGSATGYSGNPGASVSFANPPTETTDVGF